MATHEVLNQTEPLLDYDMYAADPVLRDAVEREGGSWGHDHIADSGLLMTSEEAFVNADLANRFEPELVTHDRFGHRIDEVAYHPAYHWFMRHATSNGIHGLPYERPSGEGARVVRDAMFWTLQQIEPAHTCPISMTTSVVPALRHNPALAAAWEPTSSPETMIPNSARSVPTRRRRYLAWG